MHQGLATLAIAALCLAACGDNAAVESEQSMPAAPDWARGYIGQGIGTAFQAAGAGACVGYADAVTERFGGSSQGVRIAGWGWNLVSSQGYGQILTAGANGVIIGAGTTTTNRPDVVEAMGETVTTPLVGYDAYAATQTGQVAVYGIDAAAATACPIGVIELD